MKNVLLKAKEFICTSFPADKSGMQCGDDLLGRFVSSSPPLLSGDSILLVGENLFESLSASEIKDLKCILLQTDIVISIASFMSSYKTTTSEQGHTSILDIGNGEEISVRKYYIPMQDFLSGYDIDELLTGNHMKFSQIWCNPEPSLCYFAGIILSFYLKPNGILKIVLPDNDDKETLYLEAHAHLLSVIERYPSMKYHYRPLPEQGRGFPECFVVFQSQFDAVSIADVPSTTASTTSKSYQLVVSQESKWGGAFIETISTSNAKINQAIDGFVSAQNIAKQMMQTVWLRGCYVAALLILEASSRCKSKSNLAAFKHYTKLCLVQSFFTRSRFVESDDEVVFYEVMKDKLQLDDLYPRRQPVTSRLRKYSQVLEDCIDTWIILLSCPLTTFSKHNQLPLSWGLREQSRGSDPIGNFILSKQMQVKLGNSYINYLKWIHEFVPLSLKTSSMIYSQHTNSTLQIDQAPRDEADFKLTFSIAVDDLESDDDILGVEKTSPRKKRRTAPQTRAIKGAVPKVEKKKKFHRVVTKRTQARMGKKTKSRAGVVDDIPIIVEMDSLTAEASSVVENQGGLTDIGATTVDSENFDFGREKKVTESEMTPVDSNSVLNQCSTESLQPIVESILDHPNQDLTEVVPIVESMLHVGCDGISNRSADKFLIENKAETFSLSEDSDTLTDPELLLKTPPQIQPENADLESKQLMHFIIESLQRASPKLLQLIYSIIIDHDMTTK